MWSSRLICCLQCQHHTWVLVPGLALSRPIQLPGIWENKNGFSEPDFSVFTRKQVPLHEFHLWTAQGPILTVSVLHLPFTILKILTNLNKGTHIFIFHYALPIRWPMPHICEHPKETSNTKCYIPYQVCVTHINAHVKHSIFLIFLLVCPREAQEGSTLAHHCVYWKSVELAYGSHTAFV